MDRKPENQEIMEFIVENNILLTNSNTGIIYYLKNGVYKPFNQSTLDTFITKNIVKLHRRYSMTLKNDVIALLKERTCKNWDKVVNSTNDSFSVNNGIYFLKPKPLFIGEKGHEDRNFHPHNDWTYKNEYFSFNQIPVDFIPSAQCPRIDMFLEQVFGKDMKQTIYEFIGYLLLPHIRYQKALILVGTGRNGKTTFLDLIIRFLGVENIAMIGLNELEDKFSLLNLQYKMANIVGDLPKKTLYYTGNIKRVATDQYLSGHMKHVQGIFNFLNRCKMLYSCNELPPVKDITPAFFRRWILGICSNEFDKNNRDINILDKLTTPEELSGLLNKAILGINELIMRGGFDYDSNQVRAFWSSETNPVIEFINDCCIRTKGTEIRSRDLFIAFNKYRSQRELENLTGKQIGYYIRQAGIQGIQHRDSSRLDEYGNPKWYTFYQNLELNEMFKINENKTLEEY